MESKKINVAIVDDNSLFLQLLKNFIENKGKYKIVVTAKSGNDFLNELDKTNVEILILDLKMINGDGIDVMVALSLKPVNIKIIVLSSFYRRSFMGQMLKYGANAFLSKEIDLEELITVIDTVHEKGHYFSNDQIDVMRTQLSAKLPQFNALSKDDITEREADVLKLICQQLNTKEIADKLYISPKTVETHKTNLMAKANVKNMAGLVIYAVQNNIVNVDEIVLFDK